MVRIPYLKLALVLLVLALPAPTTAQQLGTEIIVTVADDGFLLPLPGVPLPCTLRAALEAANTNTAVGGCDAGTQPKFVSSNPLIIDGIDRISFEFDSGDTEIVVRTALPPISEAVLVDGALASGERLVLNGGGILQAVFAPPAHGLVVMDSNTTLKDLVIQNFPGHGIFLTAMDESGAPLPSPFDPPDFEEDPPQGDPGQDPCGPNSYPNPDDPCDPPSGGGSPEIPPVSSGGGGGHTILGCRIGTTADGTTAAPNQLAGVGVTTAGNRIGGETPEEGNLISGNLGEGVAVSGHNNTVIGNLIGLDADGNAPVPNGGAGVRLAAGQFGGTLDLVQNTIHFNDGDGVRVASGQVFAAANSIDDNAGLGMDLGPAGATPSVTGWPPAPALAAWVLQAFGRGQICGQLPTMAANDVVIEFFQTPGCDPSGFGEGRKPIGSVTVAAGSLAFQFVPPGSVSGLITATATYAGGGTSEFSECLSGPSLVTKCPPILIGL